MSNSEYSQNQRILGYMRLNGSITPLEAIRRFQCYRLGARIYELKRAGYSITARKVKSKTGKFFSRYSLS